MASAVRASTTERNNLPLSQQTECLLLVSLLCVRDFVVMLHVFDGTAGAWQE
jgi:hypothetical protein